MSLVNKSHFYYSYQIPKITLLHLKCLDTVAHVFFCFISSVPGWNWESLALTSLTQPIPGPAVIADFVQCVFSPPFSWRPAEERMGNSDVINLGTAGQRSMQTLRVPRFGAHVFVPRRWWNRWCGAARLCCTCVPACWLISLVMWNVTICSPVPLTPSCVNANHWQEDSYLSHVKSGAWRWAICQQLETCVAGVVCTTASYSKRTTMTSDCRGVYAFSLVYHINIYIFPLHHIIRFSALDLDILQKNKKKHWIWFLLFECVFFFNMFAFETVHLVSFILASRHPFISPPSTLVALFWPLNGQQCIRGPSGVTFFIVERHNQWHFNHGKIKICKFELINICITCLNNRSPDKTAIN